MINSNSTLQRKIKIYFYNIYTIEKIIKKYIYNIFKLPQLKSCLNDEIKFFLKKNQHDIVVKLKKSLYQNI